MPSASRKKSASPAHRAPGAAGARPTGAWGVPAMLAGVGAVALLWRMLYLSRLEASPLAGALFSDSLSYWEWSRLIVANGPVGNHAFFLGPLYAYVLALLRLLGAGEALAVLRMQALCGAAAAVLLADAVRRLTSWRWGLAAGLAVALHPMVVFFDGLVLQESLLFAVEAALLWWVVARDPRTAPPWAWAVTGALVGLLAQGRATSLALLAPAALALGAVAGGRARVVRAAVMLAACAALALPAALHNRAATGEWIPFTYSGGYNLRVGNNPTANGTFVPITLTDDLSSAHGEPVDGGADLDGRVFQQAMAGREYSAAQSDRRWAAEAFDWMRTHPARAAVLALRKLAMLANVREYPQVENADEFAELAGPLGLPRAPLVVLLFTLAGGGLAAAWRMGGAARAIAAWPFALALALAPFFVTDRYRPALVPALVVLAAIGARSLAAARARPPRAVLAGAAIALGLALLPLPGLGPVRYRWGVEGDLGARWLQHGDPQRALVHLQRAAALDRDPRIGWTGSASEFVPRAITYHLMGQALLQLGRTDEAIVALERAHRLAPDSESVGATLARAYLAAGRVDDARALGDAGVTISAGEPAYQQGLAAARAGDLVAAAARFAEATAADPRHDAAWGALVRVHIQQDDREGARLAYEAARAAGWNGPQADAHQALVVYAAGDPGMARQLFARIDAAARRDDPVLREIESILSR